MNYRALLATTRRVLTQLLHDRRTLLLLFVVPLILLILLKYVFQGQTATFNQIAPTLLAVFPLLMMFLITSIVTLRERTSGTLDRLLTMPIAKLDLIGGYALAFSLLGLVQALLTTTLVLGPLHVQVAAGSGLTILSAVLTSFLGTAMGLFVSAFAKSEFQAVQFMPAFLFPQLLTCGLFVARSQMAPAIRWFSDVMPLTYSVDALQRLVTHAGWSALLARDYCLIIGYAVVALIAGAVTIRRQE